MPFKKKSTSEIVEEGMKKKKKHEKAEQLKNDVANIKDNVVSSDKKKGEKIIDDNITDDKTLFGADRKDVKEIISPEGLNFVPNEYMVVYDGVASCYTMSMYINRLPKTTTFATTYARLFNFPNVLSNVYIRRLDGSEAQAMSDKRVRALGADVEDCIDSKTGRVKDQNKHRRVSKKYAESIKWAEKIESGDNALYAVQFLFTIRGNSLDELKRNVNAFHTLAASSTIELVSCFCMQDEAYLSAYPLNKARKIGKKDFIKTHYLDNDAMGDIFNHVNSHFFHENGVFVGHYIDNHQMIVWDPFDKSHENYGVMFLGASGVGKSATIKMLQKRLIDFGMRVRTLDVDSPSRWGEYAPLAKAVGGKHFEIKPDSKNVLNPYDINAESVFDQETGLEYDTLALDEKLSYLENLILSMVEMGEGTIEKVTEKALKSIVTTVNYELYSERGIYDKKPDSLYTDEITGLVSSGRHKKLMPTLSDAYKKILTYRRFNKNEYYSEAFQILVDSMKEYVREIYYSEDTCRFFSAEEYEALKIDKYGRKVVKDADGKEEPVIAVRGIRPYFDGQSTLAAGYSTPYIDYDISQLPRNDKPFAMIVCLGYIEENDVRTNSSNPLRAEKMVVLMDELHTAFPYEKAREIIVSFYRQARKRWISPWCATQSVADFDLYPDMLAIFKNSDSQFIFRHSDRDRDYITQHLPLTKTQVEQILDLGLDPSNVEATVEERNARRGEVCLIDAKRVAFIKVDYLVSSEAKFVETNIAKIKELTQRAVAGR